MKYFLHISLLSMTNKFFSFTAATKRAGITYPITYHNNTVMRKSLTWVLDGCVLFQSILKYQFEFLISSFLGTKVLFIYFFFFSKGFTDLDQSPHFSSKGFTDLDCVSFQPLFWMHSSTFLFKAQIFFFFPVSRLIVNIQGEFRFVGKRSLSSKWMKT